MSTLLVRPLVNKPLGEEQVLQLNRIYEESFPPEERRPSSELFSSQSSTELSLYSIVSVNPSVDCFEQEGESKLIGFLTLWFFESFVFVEHFCLDLEYRNRGYGTQAVEELKAKLRPLPIVLECELGHTSVEAKRRLGFYLRLGFEFLPLEYAQPSYQPGGVFIPMHLLSTKCWLASELTLIKEQIYRKVYKFSTGFI